MSNCFRPRDLKIKGMIRNLELDITKSESKSKDNSDSQVETCGKSNHFLFFLVLTNQAFPFKASLPDFMNSDQRIVGGFNATAPIPWQVSITLKNIFVGGGTIIGRRTIITAAHILYAGEPKILYTDPSDYEIRVSPWRRFSDGILVEAKKIIPHENFTFPNDDVAIIQLKQPLQFTEHVSPVCLTKENFEPKEGTYCYVSGFGYTERDQITTDPGNILFFNKDSR